MTYTALLAWVIFGEEWWLTMRALKCERTAKSFSGDLPRRQYHVGCGLERLRASAKRSLHRQPSSPLNLYTPSAPVAASTPLPHLIPYLEANPDPSPIP